MLMRFIVCMAIVIASFSFQTHRARASAEVRLDAFASILGIELLTRSHAAVFMGFGGFSLGPYINYDPLHSYLTDMSYGVAMRFGNADFLEIGGGYFERKYESLKGKGFAGHIIFGRHFTNSFSVSLPIIYKRIESGLDKRTIVDVVPYFGLRIAM